MTFRQSGPGNHHPCCNNLLSLVNWEYGSNGSLARGWVRGSESEVAMCVGRLIMNAGLDVTIFVDRNLYVQERKRGVRDIMGELE